MNTNSPAKSNPAPIPAAQACDVVNTLTSASGSSIAILSGAECSMDRGPVVKLNVEEVAGAEEPKAPEPVQAPGDPNQKQPER